MTSGAEQLIANARHNGIDTCFANPGTTELHLVAALDAHDDVRTVLCTFEGVCSGAADAYGRMSGRPALGVYHLGPGYANSLANQHNARRHHAPMINLIGDQATWHLEHDAPLTSDIEALGDWTGETRYIERPDQAASMMSAAIADVRSSAPRQVSLVIPADSAWGECEPLLIDAAPAPRRVPETGSVSEAAHHLSRPGATLIVGGEIVNERSTQLLQTIAQASGCRVRMLRVARLETGRNLPAFEELPYFPAPLSDELADTTVAVLAGRPEPVTFFGYPDTPSLALPPSADRFQFCDDDADLEASLELLAAELGGDASGGHPAAEREPLPELDLGELTTDNLGVAVARSLVDGHIVVGESLTSGGTYNKLASRAAPHTLLGVLGGAIGGGLPAAVGAAVACPDRPVLALQADGSALYTIQSLWTMAREQLDVTVVICANRRYQILDVEFANHHIELSNRGRQLTNLADPAISYTALASGFGVAGRNVSTGAELAEALEWAASEPGPHLIEAEL